MRCFERLVFLGKIVPLSVLAFQRLYIVAMLLEFCKLELLAQWNRIFIENSSLCISVSHCIKISLNGK